VEHPLIIVQGEKSGTVLDARRMSTVACYDLAASGRRRSSRKSVSHNFFGGAAVGCLVLGCAWTVYANIFAASVYPTMSGGSFDEAVVKPPQALASRSAPVAKNVVVAFAEPRPPIAAPATVPPGPSLSFDDRFAAASPQGVAPTPIVEAPNLAEAPKPRVDAPKLAEAAKPKAGSQAPPPLQVAAIAPAPPKTPGSIVSEMAQRAKAAVMSIASVDKPSIVEKLWGKPQSKPSLLAFASADASVTGSLGSTQNPALGGAQPLYDRSTAVYDISAHMVYLPDGSKLEAHSGLGDKLDDPRSASIRMRGVTPPHLYDLTLREALFHGVPALRLNPVGGEEAIYGRSGLLAHSFMLGPNGDSNGCVSFRDYNAFLNAYRNQGIKRLAVVTRID
jgi:type VI secretion system (T6SS) effector TldE1-like protein